MSDGPSRNQLMLAIHKYAMSDDARLFPSTYSQGDSYGKMMNLTGQASIVLGSMFASPALRWVILALA